MTEETKIPDGFKKVEQDIFKFEKEGDSIQGVLKAVEENRTYKGNVYKLQTKDGLKAVFGTTVLDSKMSAVSLEQEVVILYSGTAPAKVKGQNDTKLFEVYVK